MKTRGYVDRLLHREPVFSVGEWIAWDCESMGGIHTGTQLRHESQKKYLWLQAEGGEHLPLVYGTDDDYQVLWKTGQVFLVEGIFDRVALKRAFPDRACLARLSKSMSRQLKTFLERYSKRVWVVLDTDEPGEAAAVKAIRALGSERAARLWYPAKDPADLLLDRGIEKTKRILERQMELVF